MTIDPEDLRKLLADMQPRQVAYEIVKAEMIKRGRWKALPRGKVTPENLIK